MKTKILYLGSAIASATPLLVTSCLFLEEKFNIDDLPKSNFVLPNQPEVVSQKTIAKNLQDKSELLTIIENNLGSKNLIYLTENEVNNITWISSLPLSNKKIKEIINKAFEIKKELIELNDIVHNTFGLYRDKLYVNERYQKYLNFIKKFLVNSNNEIKNVIDKALAKHNDPTVETKNWGKNFLATNNNWDRLMNNKKGLYIKMLKRIKQFENNSQLVFSNEKSYIPDLSKLNLINDSSIIENEWGKFKEHRNTRLGFLINGETKIKGTFNIKNNASIDESVILNDIIYDFTGGSNYINDVVGPFECLFSSGTNNSESYSFVNPLNYRTKNSSEEKYVTQYVLDIIPKIISVDFTKKQKIRAVHNFVTNAVHYAFYALEPNNLNNEIIKNKVRSVYEMTDKGDKLVVCEGYARMFQRFMTFLDIPSWYIYGYVGEEKPENGHAWSMVEMNGTNYYIDLTFDDTIEDSSIPDTSIDNISITPNTDDFLLITWQELKLLSPRTINEEIAKLASLRKSWNKPFFKVDGYSY